MEPDQPVCLCFHITWRKLVQFLRVCQPRVASQLANCGGAGTGCGWCIPYLQQLFHEAQKGQTSEWERLSLAEYVRSRAVYLHSGQRHLPTEAPVPADKASTGQDCQQTCPSSPDH